MRLMLFVLVLLKLWFGTTGGVTKLPGVIESSVSMGVLARLDRLRLTVSLSCISRRCTHTDRFEYGLLLCTTEDSAYTDETTTTDEIFCVPVWL